jgi:DNA-binding CsgD family transcriptional regulator
MGQADAAACSHGGGAGARRSPRGGGIRGPRGRVGIGAAPTAGAASGVGADADGRAAGLSATALRAVGLGTLFAWTNVTFFSKLIHFSTRNSISHLNSTYACMCLGTCLAMLAALLVRRRLRAAVAAGGAASGAARDRAGDGVGAGTPGTPRRGLAGLWPWCCALVLMAATVLLVMVERHLFTQPWCTIVSTAAGAAVGALSLGWAGALMREPTSRLPWTLTLALVAGAVAQLAILELPPAWGIATMVALPPLTCALLRRASRAPASSGALGRAADAGVPGRPPTEGAVEAGAAEPASGGRRRLPDVRGRFARALVSMGLLGFAEAMARAVFMTLSPATESVANHWVLTLAATAGALLLALGSACCAGEGHEWRLSRICAVELVTLLMLAPAMEGVWLLGDLATMTCHFLVTMLVWVVLVRMAHEWRMDVVDVFAPGMAASSAGVLAGTMLGSVVVSFLRLDLRSGYLIALGCAVMVMVALLFLLDDRAMVVLINADDARPSSPRRFAVRVGEVAREAGLTPRETEVMVLVAKGRTAQRIQEELGISAGTTNTHLNHVYRKLGVHDRQQMLDLLESDADAADHLAS